MEPGDRTGGRKAFAVVVDTVGGEWDGEAGEKSRMDGLGVDAGVEVACC